MIVPPTRPSITNNPLLNHNFRKEPKIICLMIEEESKENPSELIYDLPECFMMTWEELIDRTSTTTTGYDIRNEEVLEIKNYSTSTNGGRHFKPQSNNPIPTNGGETLQTPIKLLITYKRGETLQIPIKEPNIHKWGKTLQTQRYRP